MVLGEGFKVKQCGKKRPSASHNSQYLSSTPRYLRNPTNLSDFVNNGSSSLQFSKLKFRAQTNTRVSVMNKIKEIGQMLIRLIRGCTNFGKTYSSFFQCAK